LRAKDPGGSRRRGATERKTRNGALGPHPYSSPPVFGGRVEDVLAYYLSGRVSITR
jgi:hypothetical protein